MVCIYTLFQRLIFYSKCCCVTNVYCWVWEFFTYPMKKRMVKCWTFVCCKLFKSYTHKFQIFRLNAFQWGIIFLFPLFSNSYLYISYDPKNKFVVCFNFLLLVEQIFLIFKNQVKVICIALTRTSLKNKTRTGFNPFFTQYFLFKWWMSFVEIW